MYPAEYQPHISHATGFLTDSREAINIVVFNKSAPYYAFLY